MSDLVIVSKSEVEKIIKTNTFADWSEVKKDLRTLLDQSTPVSGEFVAKVCLGMLNNIGWNPNLSYLPDEGTKLYTTPQPAQDTVTVEKFNKLMEACELYEEACSYNDATPTFNRLIKKANALKAEAIKGE